MDEKRYTVSEAVRLIGVESHVLRYWEEELGLLIERTSQGHRSYSRENVELFRQVKVLRERGLQMKAIRAWMEEGQVGVWRDDMGVSHLEHSQRDDREISHMEYAGQCACGQEEDQAQEEVRAQGFNEALPCEIIPAEAPSDSLEQFTLLLKQMMEEVAREQDRRLVCAMEECIRDELEDICFRYFQALREAAAAGEKEAYSEPDGAYDRREGWLRCLWRKLFSGRDG